MAPICLYRKPCICNNNDKWQESTMTSGKIRVCILEGHQAELASAGLPFSVCLRLQEFGLSMPWQQPSGLPGRQIPDSRCLSSGPHLPM